MWNPFKKKDPLEGQRANYALAFDIVPKVLNAFNLRIYYWLIISIIRSKR